MSDFEIIVAGKAASGTSTIGRLIAKALLEAGLPVQFIDPDQSRVAVTFEDRLAAVVERAPTVRVTTRQLNRDGKLPEVPVNDWVGKAAPDPAAEAERQRWEGTLSTNDKLGY